MTATPHYDSYLNILREELLPALGCTEPIAVALASAKAMEALGEPPVECRAEVSGNIIKNVKAVTVPNTGGLRGIEAAVAAGIVGGRPELGLEVLSRVTPEEISAMGNFLRDCPIHVLPAEGDRIFYIRITLRSAGHTAGCEIADYHTNITRIWRDEACLYQGGSGQSAQTDRSVLSVEEIVAFADTMDSRDAAPVLERQIACSTAISREGLKGGWGAEVGKTLLRLHGDRLDVRLRAAAAAGSDARMNGCELPVIIVSGSGNQGMTASLPVIEYANAIGADHDRLLRALALADLITIHQKTGVGRLSGFCGATSAGCGAACGIAYLDGGDADLISRTITNTLGICSGMICDGAKSSCAAKIAAAVEAGLEGYEMAKSGRSFAEGDGIIGADVEQTIANVGRLARQGMRQTDVEILHIMLGM